MAERDEILTLISDDVKQISLDMRDLTKQFNDYRVSVEQRLTRVEIRASFMGAFAGTIGGLLSYLGMSR